MATKNQVSSKKTQRFTSYVSANPRRRKLIVPMIAIGLFALAGGIAVFNSLAASDSLSLLPATASANVGSNVTFVVHENSGTDAVNAVQTDLTYDQTKLQFVSIDTTTSAFNLGATNTGGGGNVSIARAITASSLTGDQVVASVTFKVIGTGSTSVSFAGTSALVRASDATLLPIVTFGATLTLTDSSAPSVPSGLTAGPTTVSSTSFSWAGSTDNVAVTGYKVYRNGTLINGNVSTNSFSDSGLTPKTSYSYTVAAFDAAGNVSSQSTALLISTLADTTAPTKPASLTAGTRTVNSIGISWTASVDDIATTGYNIFRNGTKVGVSNVTTYTDTGLAANTSYTYTVSAYDAAGNTSAVSTTLSTSTLADTVAPSTPTGLTASNITTSSVKLSWSASSDNVAVTGYKIFRNGSATPLSTTASTSYTDSGLPQGTSYTYTVAAYDAAGNTSAVSASVPVTTIIKQGDITGDGNVDINDLSVLAAHFGESGQTLSSGDLNSDGTVNIYDLSILARYWGSAP